MYKKLLRLGFFLLYNHLAFSYDLIAWLVSLGQWPMWRETVLEYLQPDDDILELAYGTGGLYATLEKSGFDPIGLDLSPFMARITAKRLRKARLGASIIRAQAQYLPFPARTFTHVIATFPTNYISEPETLSEIHRVLVDVSEQAKLIIVWQGQLKHPKYLVAFINWLYRITGQESESLAMLLTPFEEAGFEANWEIARLEKSSATILIANKRL